MFRRSVTAAAAAEADAAAAAVDDDADDAGRPLRHYKRSSSAWIAAVDVAGAGVPLSDKLPRRSTSRASSISV